MNSLNAEQLKNYEDHGFVSPINALSFEEATKIKEEKINYSFLELDPYSLNH